MTLTTDPAYDLAIIGSGSAAFAAAIAASDRGGRVVMAERGTVGGTCVNVGCVPSKALLAAAGARHGAAAAGRFPGLSAGTIAVDQPALIGGKDALVEQLRADKYADLAADYGWAIMPGTATFAGSAEDPILEVAAPDGPTRRIRAAHYLIATGSSPWAPPIDGLEEVAYLTSTTAMDLQTLPDSMAVVGGNAVGLELAQMFARLGTRVTVIEALDRLAPFEEPEVSAAIEDAFTGEGITVRTAMALTAVRHDGHAYSLTAVRDGRPTELRTEQVLIATGRRPVTTGLNLDRVGVKTGVRGEVVVDDRQRTDNQRIWAAGDVTGGPQFVYVAAAQGTVAADNAITGASRTLDYTTAPRVIFTSPGLAAVGMTEAAVNDAGGRCDCRTLPLAYVPRAMADRDTRGLVKLVADADTRRLLGVHVVADGAGDLITAAGYAIAAGMTVDRLADTWAPYLTMSEALKLAAQTYTRDITTLSCCAG